MATRKFESGYLKLQTKKELKFLSNHKNELWIIYINKQKK